MGRIAAIYFVEAMMLNPSASKVHTEPRSTDPAGATFPAFGTASDTEPIPDDFDGDIVAEWSEEDIIFLHWRLLKDVADLADPEAPLEEKLDMLSWIFTEHDKEEQPFSFVNCVKIVGCSPLSPMPYFGPVDAEEIRDAIRCRVKVWLIATLERYPSWVREAISSNPDWVESRLNKNPQWLNEQVRKRALHGDLFA